ncbi:MAG: TIGR01777 family protein [SAR202 cluster bacterium]|nr:TIGR01777 family protein [SAR202 cluster bacterium]|tara:strand:- start:2669 stop:3568 length:900 start_codon:yes stop_codon:yes gene_type:complete
MKILISGSSGLIGKSLINFLESKKHEIFILTRNIKENSKNSIFWDPYKNIIDLNKIENFDVFINLNGSSIAKIMMLGRIKFGSKKSIYNSRIISTKFLRNCVEKLSNPPKLYMTASACGYYGDRGNSAVEESSKPGLGFLSDTAKIWENIAIPNKKNVRVVNLRLGLVITKNGGIIKSSKFIYKSYLGGKYGNGNQWWPWISMKDTIRAVEHIIENKSINGPVNLVSPKLIRNKDFVKELSIYFKKPAILNLPSYIIKIFFGEIANEALLSSQKVIPKKLSETNFSWEHLYIKQALDDD